MQQVLRRGLIVVACLALVPGISAAQGTSAASISGVVKDTSGAVLPGVTVEAASPVLIEKVRSTVTDENGEYRIIELRPGSYTVTFALSGFATFRSEGLELRSNFTATLNAELRVGSLEETLTVTGETPLVDVQNVSQQQTISKTLLDAVPTGKSVLGYAALMPSAVNPGTAQDVGGSMGESSVRISVHGAKQSDQKLLQDGMSYNILGQGGTGRTYFINPLAAQEIVIDVGSGGSAENPLGGAMVNLIPKDGGNRFSGTFFGTATGHQMQGDNLDDDLRSQGLTTVNAVRNIYDVNAVLGGPIVQDKLWFMTSHRVWGRESRFANLFWDANVDDWLFTPDPNRPGDAGEDFRAHNIRTTWQVAAKHKITASYDYQKNNSNVQGGSLGTGTRSLEAIVNPDVYCNQPNLIQATWTHPARDRLLFEAGHSQLINLRSVYKTPCGGTPLENAVLEQSTGLIYHGSSRVFDNNTRTINERFSATYLTGAHSLKFGTTFFRSFQDRDDIEERGRPGFPVDFRLNNGIPNRLTQFVSPRNEGSEVRASIGLFAQDNWSLGRATLVLGLRYEYHNSAATAVDAPEGLLGPPSASFPERTCLPCWHDINPRAAVAYDLFGDGKTALKASVGRYVSAITTELASNFSPAGSRVLQANRSWTDVDRDYVPDCDLKNPAAQNLTAVGGDLCGALDDQNFGQNVPGIQPDPDWITGWGNRGYNWRTTLEIERQVLPGLAISGGYYRTWWGNQTVIDNTLVTPADYDPFCFTAVVDARLPGDVSGATICGLYDLNPTKFGQVANVQTLASNFGEYREVYNGGDINFTARLAKGVIMAGGWNVGNSVNTSSNAGAIGLALGTNSQTDTCFVVDTPQQLYNCKSGNPYQHRVKLNSSIPLPWETQVAFVYQNLPGPNYNANQTVTSAAIAPSLGRSLSGGVNNVTVGLLVPNAAFVDDRVNQLDIRLTKIFRMGGARFQGNFDLYNLFNNNAVLNVNSTYGSQWLQPTQILDARLMKFSVQVDF